MSFDGVPADSNDERQHRRQMAAAINRLNRGKYNATGTITLTANVATTSLIDSRLGPDSLLKFDPMTANAAAAWVAGTMYVLEANRGQGTWVITHANNAQTDRKFKYLIVG